MKISFKKLTAIILAVGLMLTMINMSVFGEELPSLSFQVTNLSNNSSILVGDVFKLSINVSGVNKFGSIKSQFTFDSNVIVPTNVSGTIEYTAWNNATRVHAIDYDNFQQMPPLLTINNGTGKMIYTLAPATGTNQSIDITSPYKVLEFYFKAKSVGSMGLNYESSSYYFENSAILTPTSLIYVANPNLLVKDVPQAPVASDVSLPAVVRVGESITGSYTFTDANASDIEAGSTFKWYLDGNVIDGQTAKTISILPAYIGKTLEFEVTPKSNNADDPASVAVKSNGVKVSADLSYVPTFKSSVTISNPPLAGKSATANYELDGTYANAVDNSTFEWFAVTESGEVSIGSGKTVTFPKAYTDKAVKLYATPKALIGGETFTGNTVTISVGTIEDEPPVLTLASTFDIGKDLYIDNAVTVETVYSDPNSLPKGEFSYKWSKADTFDGTYAAILGATGATYTPVAADLGKYICAEITPVNSEGVAGEKLVVKFTKAVDEIKVKAPMADIASGAVLAGTYVELSSDANATIYYTTDGSTPTANSTVYKRAIEITGAVTIKAIAIADGLASGVSTYEYTVIDSNATVLKVSSHVTKVGKEIDVTVDLLNNPGIAAFDLKLMFDKTKLQPIAITQGSVITTAGALVSNLQESGASGLDYVTAFIANPANITGNGTLFTVKFKVLDGAGNCTTPILIGYGPDDILNQNQQAISPLTANGKVFITTFTYGDILVDDNVDAKDLLKLSQYLAEYKGVSLTEAETLAADVYFDNKINIRDALKLAQFLAGWEGIELGK